MTDTTTRPTIVLVHGAWADGSSWDAVTRELQADGYTVLAPPNLLRGLTDDAAYIAAFLAQHTSGPVVLVGHSYGGAVITNAATGGGDVRALVYVNAFMPDEGETVVQLIEGTDSALGVADPTTIFDFVAYPGAPEGVVEVFLKPEVVHTSFAPDLPEADRWTIVASQRPASLIANIVPSGTPAWRTLPSWAVIGTDDRIIPVGLLRRMAERAGSTVSELNASHVSMVSRPEAALAAIRAAIASV